jgi:hypothetical protein
MADGSTTIDELVLALAQEPGDKPHIVRNLLYLIASGQLTPFTRGGRSTLKRRNPRFASATIRNMVTRAGTSGGADWIASAVSGSGIRMDHTEARAVIDHVEGEPPAHCLSASQVERLLRLGILA